ncbi:MAG: tryptophan 7-halogenase [Dokdonella sp.]
MTSDERSDVLILGGGLAGLSLAIQLRREQPTLSVRILERNRHPVPHAAFKVGESLVEIGAHYFHTVLGLGKHLDSAQIRKFGFRFFFNEGHEAIERTPELGVSRVFPTPSYQLDRGIFENYLGEHAAELGAEFIDGAVVRKIIPGNDGADHCVHYTHDGSEYSAHARWMIDASGRAGLLKRQFDLAEANAHDVNAAWFRIDDRVSIDTWSQDEAWQDRCTPRERWRSTNHLCGPGYWVWLIPLASGSHSIGIVADGTMHPLQSINTFDKAMDWLAIHQPQLHGELSMRRGSLQDFAFLRHFSYGCKQVFSAERWALTGEAGLFLDPFYSPGSDFIAIGNTYITDLIGRDMRGEHFARHARAYERLYFSFYRNTMAMYQDQYPMFGHAELMPLKVMWDYAYYWGVLCQFFFKRRMTDMAMFIQLGERLEACEALNRDMQLLLRRAAGSDTGTISETMIDQARLPWFAELNRGLNDELDDGAFELRIRDNVAMLHALAGEMLERVRETSDPAMDELPMLAALVENQSQLLCEAA